MNFTLSNVLSLAVGAAIGSAATWYFLKTKYERIAEEEIQSIREMYGVETPEETEEDDRQNNIKDHKEEYKKIIENSKYVDYSGNKIHETEEVEEMRDVEKPYVIRPEEFGELDDYETVSLVYYEDGVLTDDHGEIVEDVDNTVGLESLEHFGEYEDDSVFVRNDILKCDFEILLDESRYGG